MKTFIRVGLIILLSIVLGVLFFFSSIALVHPVFGLVWGALVGFVALFLCALIRLY